MYVYKLHHVATIMLLFLFESTIKKKVQEFARKLICVVCKLCTAWKCSSKL